MTQATHTEIIVIEDEADILEIIRYNLQREGFIVRLSRNGEEGLRKIRAKSPDLVLLDLMLPGMDGLEICRQLRSNPRTTNMPIIMVSAKGEESDIVLGLGLGADDYVVKPFSPKELIARVKAVMRRGATRENTFREGRIVREGVIIDAGRHEVRVDHDSVVFTATEMKLLHFLASHPGRVFTRDHILSAVFRDDAFVIDRNVDVHIRAIRKKLGPYRRLIETIHGIGYRFKDDGA